MTDKLIQCPRKPSHAPLRIFALFCLIQVQFVNDGHWQPKPWAVLRMFLEWPEIELPEVLQQKFEVKSKIFNLTHWIWRPSQSLLGLKIRPIWGRLLCRRWMRLKAGLCYQWLWATSVVYGIRNRYIRSCREIRWINGRHIRSRIYGRVMMLARVCSWYSGIHCYSLELILK